MKPVLNSIRVFLEILVVPFFFRILVFPILLLTTFWERFSKKTIEIGLGPEPFVSHIYHKKALENLSHTVQMYVNAVYAITDQFDVHTDRWIKTKHLKRLLLPIILFVWSVHQDKCAYIHCRVDHQAWVPCCCGASNHTYITLQSLWWL